MTKGFIMSDHPLPVPADTVAEGNRQVVEMLEAWLAKAKLGKICHVSLVACESPVLVFDDHAGTSECHFAAYFGIDHLKRRLADDVQPSRARSLAAIDYGQPANLVAYDVSMEPMNFDFFVWMLTAEMSRVREGAPPPLKVAFIEQQTNVTPTKEQEERRTQMFDNVMGPAVKMCGAVIDGAAVCGRRPEHYSLIGIVEAVRAGEEVPHLYFSQEADDFVAARIGDKPPVVITLREADYWPHRNSNLPAWIQFAQRLEAEGENVIVVRDTAKAHKPLKDLTIFPEASIGLDIRLALYERAKVNLMVSTGPWMLALFGSRPWMMYIHLDPMEMFIPNTPRWWQRNHGICQGEQFPWSRPDQKIIWDFDSYEVLCQSWDSFKAQHLRNAA